MNIQVKELLMNTLQIPKARLDLLIHRFPRLYAEYPSIFHMFFSTDGKMNERGYCTYDLLKQKRHRRMQSPPDTRRTTYHDGCKNL